MPAHVQALALQQTTRPGAGQMRALGQWRGTEPVASRQSATNVAVAASVERTRRFHPYAAFRASRWTQRCSRALDSLRLQVPGSPMGPVPRVASVLFAVHPQPAIDRRLPAYPTANPRS